MSYLEGAVVVMEVVTELSVNCEEEAVEPEFAKLKLKIVFIRKQIRNLRYFEFVPEQPQERWRPE